MIGVMLTFSGAFATFTYLRPFLETYTHVTLPQLSLLLLGWGWLDSSAHMAQARF
jgi:predicted MFS family arabinose efflux permease